MAVIDRRTGVPRTYWREISLALAAKAVGLVLLYLLFFAAPPLIPSPAHHLFHQGDRK